MKLREAGDLIRRLNNLVSNGGASRSLTLITIKRDFLTNRQQTTLNEIVTRYERSFRSDEPSSWVRNTIIFLEALEDFCTPRGLLELGYDTKTAEHWYTRMASSLTECVAHPATTINHDQLFEICKRKFIIDYIFSASGYRSTAHFAAIIGATDDGGLRIPETKLAILLAFISINDLLDEALELALRQEPNILLCLMLGWLNQRAVFTPKGERFRSKLLVSGHLIENAVLTDSQVQYAINGWMYSTYAESPQKHSIKSSLNVLLHRLLTNAGISPPMPTYSGQKKPRLLVIHERFLSVHAMFRCYAPLIEPLKDYFEMSAMVEEEHIDDVAMALFDGVYKLEKGTKSIPTLVNAIQKIAPDVIYFPSLGMSHWTVLLAQLRLAPIQVMTHGHPATSMSPEIDYVYLNSADEGLAALQSEKVLVGDAPGVFAPHVDLPENLPKIAPPTDREVRIAVNSKVMKLSARLMTVCKRLVKESEIPIKFAFFPGERGLLFDGLVQAIKAEIPDAEVLPYCGYEEFLDQLAECDMALAAFPFGNTNSTVDTCLLGLPTVVHYGQESASQTDALVITTAGFPEWLICETDDEYFNAALELARSRDKRQSITKNMNRAEVYSRLFSTQAPDQADRRFADMLWYVYEHHENLKSQPKRIIRHSEVVGA